ncbi:MAG: DUF2975 domain-containing protein [Dinoroseobacter sp.]|nr:DUF2975 domain-containing protein [Dinoroseobacter sp.]
MKSRLTVETALLATTWGALVLLPAVMIWALVSGVFTQEALIQRFPDVVRTNSLLGWQLCLAAVLGLIPATLAFWVLWQVKGLFGLYAKGQALTPAAADRIRATGIGLAGIGLLNLVVHAAQTVVLSATNPAGQRMLAIELGSEEVGLALMGGLLFVIGRAMADAAEAATELRAFV